MKKLGFLLFALTAPVAFANPQTSVTTSVVTAGVDTSWTAEHVEKNANTTQINTLNSLSLSFGKSITTDLDEKIAQRLRAQENLQ